MRARSPEAAALLTAAATGYGTFTRQATPWRRVRRIPGPARPAGSKLARMAAERRIAKAHP